MFTKLTHALHHLFNPHCSHCESLRERDIELKREHELELRVCQSCETLKTQLEFQNQLIRELTAKPINEVQSTPEDFKPILPKHKPWSVRRNELERADRELAKKLRGDKERQITADNLDEELESLENSNA
jgi:hypothetical protein